MQLSESNVTVVGFERSARGMRDGTDATLENRTTDKALDGRLSGCSGVC